MSSLNQFLSFKQSLLQLFSNTFSKESRMGMFHEIDEASYFAERVNQHMGTMCKIGEFLPKSDMPQFFTSHYSIAIGGRTVSANAAHYDREIARAKARGEALERFSSYFPIKLIKKYPDTLFVDKLRKKTKLTKSILGFRFKILPNHQIYFGFPKKIGTDRERNSNGYAGHFSRGAALVNGLLELVERDAFLVHWLNTISPPRISLADYIPTSSDTEYLLRSLRMYNIEHYFLDITSDIQVPVCLCVLAKESATGKRYFLGAAAGFDFEKLLLSSASEALAVLNNRFTDEPFLLDSKYTPYDKKSTIGQLERMRIFFTTEMEQHIAFLINSTIEVAPKVFISSHGSISKDCNGDTGTQLKYLKKIFSEKFSRDKKWDVFAIHIKNRLLNEFNFYVLRVVCEGLYSLYLRESSADPEHPRLNEFVNAMGHKKAKRNIWPHPFP